jgi:hypothetical protein
MFLEVHRRRSQEGNMNIKWGRSRVDGMHALETHKEGPRTSSIFAFSGLVQ